MIKSRAKKFNPELRARRLVKNASTRPIDHTMFVLIGRTGVGKTTTIRNLIGGYENLRFDTSDDAPSETRKTTEYLLELHCKSKDDNLRGKKVITLSIVDTPGFDDTDGEDQEARNFAAIKTFFDSHESLNPVPGGSQRDRMPNLIMLLLDATDTRYLGPNAPLEKALRLLGHPDINLTNRGMNLIIILTRAGSLAKSTYKEHTDKIRKNIQSKVSKIVKLPEYMKVPVVFLENHINEETVVNGWSMLPDGKIQPNHLFSAMNAIFSRNQDNLAWDDFAAFFGRNGHSTKLAEARQTVVEASSSTEELTEMQKRLLNITNVSTDGKAKARQLQQISDDVERNLANLQVSNQSSESTMTKKDLTNEKGASPNDTLAREDFAASIGQDGSTSKLAEGNQFSMEASATTELFNEFKQLKESFEKQIKEFKKLTEQNHQRNFAWQMELPTLAAPVAKHDPSHQSQKREDLLNILRRTSLQPLCGSCFNLATKEMMRNRKFGLSVDWKHVTLSMEEKQSEAFTNQDLHCMDATWEVEAELDVSSILIVAGSMNSPNSPEEKEQSPPVLEEFTFAKISINSERQNVEYLNEGLVRDYRRLPKYFDGTDSVVIERFNSFFEKWGHGITMVVSVGGRISGNSSRYKHWKGGQMRFQNEESKPRWIGSLETDPAMFVKRMEVGANVKCHDEIIKELEDFFPDANDRATRSRAMKRGIEFKCVPDRNQQVTRESKTNYLSQLKFW